MLPVVVLPDHVFRRFVLLCAFMVPQMSLLFGNETDRPPVARKNDVKETIHGVEIVDPYRWLEDQKSPETRAWIDAERAYTQKFLEPISRT